MVICHLPEIFQIGAVNKTIKYFMSWLLKGMNELSGLTFSVSCHSLVLTTNPEVTC